MSTIKNYDSRSKLSNYQIGRERQSFTSETLISSIYRLPNLLEIWLFHKLSCFRVVPYALPQRPFSQYSANTSATVIRGLIGFCVCSACASIIATSLALIAAAFVLNGFPFLSVVRLMSFCLPLIQQAYRNPSSRLEADIRLMMFLPYCSP